MDRRAFISGIAVGLLAAPRAAEAQRPGKVPRIGVLVVASPGFATLSGFIPWPAPVHLGAHQTVDVGRRSLYAGSVFQGQGICLRSRGGVSSWR